MGATRIKQWLALSMLLTASIIQARAGELVLVGSSSSAAHQSFVTTLQDSLWPAMEGSIETHWLQRETDIQPLLDELHSDPPRLLITIGVEVARRLAGRYSGPTLHVMLPPELLPSLYPAGRPESVSALYYSQPLARQLNLLTLLQPERNRVLLLLGEQSVREADAMSQGLRERHFSVNSLELSSSDSLEALLSRALPGEELLFTPADPGVVNRRTIQALLLQAFQANVAVIGYSQAMVKAGALIAVHTPPDTLAEESAEIARNYLARPHAQLPPPHHPQRFRVSVNYQVARVLKIVLADEQTLTRKLQAMEDGDD